MLLSANIQAFVAIAEGRTVHAAARTLGLTQSAVTSRLQNLERELNTTLFLRSRSGMTLSEAGQSLLLFCRQVMQSQGDVLAKMRASPDSGTTQVTIQAPSSLMRSRFAPALGQLQAEHGNLIFKIIVDDYGRELDSLKSAACDIAVMREQNVPLECDSKRLAQESFEMFVPKRWSRRSWKEILESERFIDFDERDTLTFEWLEHNSLASPKLRERHFANNSDVMVSLVAAGVGFALLTKEFVGCSKYANDLVPAPKAPAYAVKWAAAWYPRPYGSDSWKAIVKALK
jgi:LysR family transcriptional regulator (chromosome initiation inhibitor)